MLLQGLGRAGQDGGEVDGVHERHEQPDEAGAPRRQAARATVGDVPALLGDPRDELAGFRSDVVTPVEDAGDGGDRDTGLLRNLADGHPGVRKLGHSRY